jgi:hypothetical protein
MIVATAVGAKDKNSSRRASPLDRYFYFILSLIIAGVVIAGFSRTVGARLLHPSMPPPVILYVHAAVFASWVALFITQTALIAGRNVRIHRKLGAFAIPLGVSIPILGVATAIVMGRLRMQRGDADAALFLAVALNDMVAFSALFGLAVYWRRRPEFHRRLMFMATCALTAAAFGRLIPASASDVWIYLGPDVLILMGIARDMVAMHRPHPVYYYAFPAVLLVQASALYMDVGRSPAWLAIAHRLIG